MVGRAKLLFNQNLSGPAALRATCRIKADPRRSYTFALDEEKRTDELLNQLAESEINQTAMAAE